MSQLDTGAPTPQDPSVTDATPGGHGEMEATSALGTSGGSVAKIDGGYVSSSAGHARGTLNVKLISARGLAVSHSADIQPQPYVVMQFEQNEFVSSHPRPVASPSSVPFTTAQAQPMTPGNLTRSSSALAVGTITRAFAEAVGRGKGKRETDGSGLKTPKAEEPVGGGSWLGKPGPGDPVWKEEVSL